MAPRFSGIHHLKFPVSDLDAGIAWFRDALGASRLGHLDHRDQHGELFGVIMQLPGLDVPVELRLAPAVAASVHGFDPVTFAVTDKAALESWVEHLDQARIAHTPVIAGLAGHLIEFATPDGIAIRLYTETPGGAANARLDPDQADLDNPWINQDLRT